MYVHTSNPLLPQAVEDQIEKMREDSNVLTNPHFLSTTSESEDKIHEGTKKAVESVKVTMDLLNATHQQLITMCQQKRDLFIVCVKFHMTTRQVCDGYVEVGVWRWVCGGGCVEVGVWRWVCGGGCVEVGVWRWVCGGGCVVVDK